MMNNDDQIKLFPGIKKRAIIEELNNIPKSFIQFSNDNISNYCLNEVKSRINADVSPRVLTNWIKEGVINVDSSDKGKIKRFDKLESIWLKLVVDLRKFGLSLSSLKYIREQLFSYVVDDFCLFKSKVLLAILNNPEYLVIDEFNNVGFYTYKHYGERASKGALISRIVIRFIDYVKEEFPNNNISHKFRIDGVDDDADKVALLYFLKTNDFIEMRINLSDGDTRLITNSATLKDNKSLASIIQKWKFESISIKINEETSFNISN